MSAGGICALVWIASCDTAITMDVAIVAWLLYVWWTERR